jgi:predicted DNA-binding WGR domain protein
MMTVIRRRDPARRMARFHALCMQSALPFVAKPTMPAPRPQPLPECSRHPGLMCPGECQYILANGVCIHDLGPPHKRSASVDLVREWGRIGSPGAVRAIHFAGVEEAEAACRAFIDRKERKGYQRCRSSVSLRSSSTDCD